MSNQNRIFQRLRKHGQTNNNYTGNNNTFTSSNACSNACTTGAMTFGDINDKNSKVAALHGDDRMYHLLEHVGTKPNVMYHVKVRNTDEV